MAPPIGLLDLPPSIRRRIYCEAGLVVDAELPLHHEERAERRQNGPSVPDLGPSLTLMLISRAFHTEVAHLLYSSNRFFIQYRRPSEGLRARDLGPLRRLSPLALSLLTFLTIHLHVSASQHKPNILEQTFTCPTAEDEPLSSSSPEGEAALSEWQTTVKHCAPHVRPGALQLSLICDVTDPETARHVIRPLDHLPALSHLHIRLSHNRDPELSRMARDASVGALERKLTHFPFRFQHLPPELRLRILEYTDLVTPLSKVSWYSVYGYSALTGQPRCRQKCKPPYDTCYPDDHWGCNGMQQCGRERPCLHKESVLSSECLDCGHYACQFRKCWNRHNNSCFCSIYHAAYSPHCNCWRAPTALFLVNRAFSEEAWAIFFSQNRFDIHGHAFSDTYYAGDEPGINRHAGSIFLMHAVPTGSLPHLRSLTISLDFSSSPASQDDPAARDWLRTIEYVKDKINPRSVTLDVSIDNYSAWPSNLDLYYTLSTGGDEAIDIVKGMAGQLWPLSNLGLNRLQHMCVQFLDGEVCVEYYMRSGPRHLFEPKSLHGYEPEFESERELSLLHHENQNKQNTGGWVEGMRTESPRA